EELATMSRAPQVTAVLLVCLAGVWIFAATTQPSPVSNHWASAYGQMAAARSGACSVLLPDGRVLIAGGEQSTGPIASSEFFGPDGRFTAAPSMMDARSAHACALLPDGRALALGGRTAGGITNAVEIYDPSTNTWTAGPAMLQPRSGATVSTLNDGRILVAGGDTGSGATATIELYDPVTAQFTPA